jgi:hypothetical protein
MTVLNSCKVEDKNLAKVEGSVIDIISHEKLANTEIQILEWHKFWISSGSYPVTKETGYTDVNGHFIINYSSNPKYDYTLGIYRDFYFKEDSYTIPLPSDKVNLGIFPQGFIKTHITNNIDTAKYVEITFAPFFSSVPIFRDGFINCNYFGAAFIDTSFITTTIGGVTNNLKILLYSDSDPDGRVVKDTSFFTLRYDTLHLKIRLF